MCRGCKTFSLSFGFTTSFRLVLHLVRGCRVGLRCLPRPLIEVHLKNAADGGLSGVEGNGVRYVGTFGGGGVPIDHFCPLFHLLPGLGRCFRWFLCL